MALLLGASIYVTLHYLKLGSNGSVQLSSTTQNNSVYGGSGGLTYSSSPLRWPIDAYTVLFDPLPFNAHGSGEYAAALENLVILGVFVSSYRQFRILPRASFARPYVMMCVVYSILFVYAFAALGNLGLIYRERVMLLPFLMVPLAIPRSPKGGPRLYEWEYRRKDRPRFRAAIIQRDQMIRSMRLAYAQQKRPAALPVADRGATNGAAVLSDDGSPVDRARHRGEPGTTAHFLSGLGGVWRWASGCGDGAGRQKRGEDPQPQRAHRLDAELLDASRRAPRPPWSVAARGPPPDGPGPTPCRRGPPRRPRSR